MSVQEEAKQEEAKQEEAKQEEAKQEDQSAPPTPTKAEEPKPADASPQDGDKPQGADLLGPTMQDEPAIEKRAKPLKDVVDEVKRSLKAEQAKKAVDKALSRAEAKIRVHQMNIARWESSPNRKDGEKPGEMDEKAIKAIADEFNLQFNESPLVEYDQMREEPLGKIVTFVFGQDGRPITQNVSNMIFGQYHEIQPFEPSKVEDFATRSTYLYWLAEKVDQQIPTFEEAKSSVEEYWKQQKAIEMARAEAKKVVEAVGSTKAPMSETYTEAVDTGSFTWFTTLGDIRYSTPVGVEQPGQEFMKQVFSLDEMSAGVAANETQEVVYAIQVTKKDKKSVEQLGTEYLDQQFFTFKRVPFDVSSLSNFYTQQVNFDWMDEFTEDMELEWVGR